MNDVCGVGAEPRTNVGPGCSCFPDQERRRLALDPFESDLCGIAAPQVECGTHQSAFQQPATRAKWRCHKLGGHAILTAINYWTRQLMGFDGRALRYLAQVSSSAAACSA